MSELFGGSGPLGSLTRRVTVLEGVKPSSIGATPRDQRLDVLEAKLRGLEERLGQVKPCSCSPEPAEKPKPATKTAAKKSEPKTSAKKPPAKSAKSPR